MAKDLNPSATREAETPLPVYRKLAAEGRPSGTQLQDWLDAEAEVRRIGELVRQLECDEQLPRHIVEGKASEIRSPGELARQLAEVEERLIRQIAGAKKAQRRLAAEHAISGILAATATLSDAASKIIQAICESLV